MKITKQLAREIADACTLDRYNKLESDTEQFKSSTHQLLMGFIPEDVRDLFLKKAEIRQQRRRDFHHWRKSKRTCLVVTR